MVANPEEEPGRQLMHQAAIRLAQPGCGARTAFLVNPAADVDLVNGPQGFWSTLFQVPPST